MGFDSDYLEWVAKQVEANMANGMSRAEAELKARAAYYQAWLEDE